MGTPFMAARLFHDAPAALPAIIRGGAGLANIAGIMGGALTAPRGADRAGFFCVK